MLALLLRAGYVEVVAQGRRHRQADDPQVRRVFEGTRDFRNATFRLRQQIDVRVLVRAAKTLRDLVGTGVAPEEPVIHQTAREWAAKMKSEVRVARTRAHDAGLDALLEPMDALLRYVEALAESESEEVVRILAEEGQDVLAALHGYERVRPLLDDKTLAQVRRTRRILRRFWPDVADHVTDPGVADRVARAQEALAGPDLPDRLGEVSAAADEVAAAYRRLYEDLHLRRGDAYQQALEQVQQWPEWEQVDVAEREPVIRPLVRRACTSLEYDEEEGTCRRCRASIPTMRSDLRAVDGYLDEVRRALRERIPPEVEAPPVVRLRLRDLAPITVLRTSEDVDTLVETLREALQAHIEQGEEVEIE